MADISHLDSLSYLFGKPSNKASYRLEPEDFKVSEQLNFEPSGQGDHLYLFIEKTNSNTDWLARLLAKKSGIEIRDVGYAGRKDRFAITCQWFSLHLPLSRNVDIRTLDGDDYRILNHTRHSHKLRKGEIKNNSFELILSDFTGDQTDFEKRAIEIKKGGFPNYFGPQRFGHGEGNIESSKAMLTGQKRVRDKNKRSIYLSAARSFLFNLVLSERIKKNQFNELLIGDYLDALATDGIVVNKENIDNYQKLLLVNKCQLTGPLPGDGDSCVKDEALLLEDSVLQRQLELYKGIQNSRIKWQRRNIREIPANFSYEWLENHRIKINFELNKGVFATSLLRELVMLS